MSTPEPPMSQEDFEALQKQNADMIAARTREVQEALAADEQRREEERAQIAEDMRGVNEPSAKALEALRAGDPIIDGEI